MLFEFGFRSSILLIFFTHIVVYSIIILRRGFVQDTLDDKLLGCFLVSGALFIVPWMTGFAGWFDHQPYRDILFYFPFVHTLVMGPLLYLYIKSHTNFTYRIRSVDLIHFIPEAIYCFWRLIAFVGDKWVLKRHFFISGQTDPDFQSWYSYLWLFSIVPYLIASLRYYRQYKTFIDLELSFADVVSFRWIRNFLYGFILLTMVTVTLKILSLFWDLEYFTSWYFFLSFGIVVYYMAIYGYNNQNFSRRKIQFDPSLLQNYETLYLESPRPVSLENTEKEGEAAQGKWDDNEHSDHLLMEQWVQKLNDLMEVEHAYRDPELTLSELARQLKTNTSVLSRVINQRFNKGFNDYINSYRVEDVKKKMLDTEYSNQTLLSVGYDAGFNSKSTFNRAFKKFEGLSPKEYLHKISGLG